jgi:hypothetical protein
MPSPAGKGTAVMFRRKVYVGKTHKEAIDAAFAGMSPLAARHVADRIAEEKEALAFGYANEDGSGFVLSDMQEARKMMYGFETPYPEEPLKP